MIARDSEKNHIPKDDAPSTDFEDIEYVPERIKEGLLQMDELDYDFWFSSKLDLYEKIYSESKTFQRPCYLRM